MVLDLKAHKLIAKGCGEKTCRGWVDFAKKWNLKKKNKKQIVSLQLPAHFNKTGDWKGWDDFWGK